MAKANGTLAAVARAEEEPRVLIFGVAHNDFAVEQNAEGVYLLQMEEFKRVVPLAEYEASLQASSNIKSTSSSVDDDKAADDDSSSIASSHGASREDKRRRNHVFAAWLVETYTRDFLSTGSGVLDIAGGKGELCEALNALSVPCVLLEPDARGLGVMVGGETTMKTTTTTTGDSPRGDANGDDGAASPTATEPSATTEVVIASLVGDGSALLQQGTEADDATDEERRVARLIRGASMVVGMHSDGATEPIVDLALLLGIPFAVIPCCVLPQLFPHRTILVGKKGRERTMRQNVRSYRSFCQYLKDKAGGRAESAHLGFVGMNQVTYTRSSPEDATGSMAEQDGLLCEAVAECEL